jgi:hypothetical protein
MNCDTNNSGKYAISEEMHETVESMTGNLNKLAQLD